MGMVKTFQPFLASMRAAGRGALVGIVFDVAGYRRPPGAAPIAPQRQRRFPIWKACASNSPERHQSDHDLPVISQLR